MNWLGIADVINHNHCDERRRYGTCHHKGCALSQKYAEKCERLDSGIGTDKDVQGVIRWLHNHTCHESRQGRTCQHTACQMKERAIDSAVQLSVKQLAA